MSRREQAEKKYRTLLERYNREYREGRWTTNRPLAGKVEDAWSAVIEAGGSVEQA